jgi:hypothetical protein
MNFSSFVPDVCAALLSGVLLTLVFFCIREWWHPLPSITGRWYCETHFTSSTLTKFIGLRLKYEITILQQGPELTGATEKIFEDSSTESFEYRNVNRVHGKLSGYIDRYYLRPNRVTFSLSEYGRKRESSAVFDLTVKDRTTLVGTFQSTAGSTSGTAIWSKDQHSNDFSELVREQRATTKVDNVSDSFI